MSGARSERTVRIGLVVFSLACLVGLPWIGPASRPFDPSDKVFILRPESMTRSEWTLVPGIGPRLASRLEEARIAGRLANRGSDELSEELLKIKGIGEVLHARIASVVDLSGSGAPRP